MTLPDFALRLLQGVRSGPKSEQIALRQIAELRKQVPWLYALLVVNSVALAYTHFPFAPSWLVLGAPGLLFPLCLARGVHWWRLRPEMLDPAEAVRRLRCTSCLTAVVASAFVAWSMMLDGYGGPYERAHVAIFVSITVIACIFCVTHLPVAALLTTVIVSGVFLAHYLTSANEVFVAIALNVAFVIFVMVRVLSNTFLAFVQLVDSEAVLGERQRELERLAAENARLAQTDSLTGLPNRRVFLHELDDAIAASEAGGATFALGIFDLDRFKPINDTYGHTMGDEVLIETGRRLLASVAPGITVARLGGDEFGILIRPASSAEETLTLCDRICDALGAPIASGAIRVATGCSGGLALYPAAGRSAAALFDRADYALFHSKERRRGVTTLFSQEHEDAIRAERAVETALRGADLDAEMEIHFQPILDTTTRRIASVEGLARWRSPTLGRVPPDRFIAAAERGGMIQSLTLLLLRKALADAVRLPLDVGLSFNLSSHDLVSSDTVIAILAAVRESRIAPHRITLELTETALVRDFDRAKEGIAALRALGMKIALDDFGTGYSSLGYVHRLPLDKIKIDRSFMADIGSDLGGSVVTTVLDLCQNLGLDCVAEGVETAEQFDAVRRHGCRYVQGYFVGAPVPIAELLGRLEDEAAATITRLRA